jgi:hypothetical protein
MANNAPGGRVPPHYAKRSSSLGYSPTTLVIQSGDDPDAAVPGKTLDRFSFHAVIQSF